MIDARKHTLDSVKKLTDYSDFNLYKMDICYDYSIDKIIDRGIFDDELLTLNPYDEYLKRLQDEIKDYKSAGRTIADYVIENNSNMEFLTYKGKDYAKIDVMYFVHESKNIIKNYEKFTLRKDDGGRWKILYWEVGKASDMEE